jgi:zinc transport system ATP-binding protein
MTENAVVQVRELCFGYGRDRVLDRVDLDIQARDFLAIIGPNGGGKSTLLKILLGLEKPWSGRVTSQVATGSGGMGYVPQHPTFDRSFPLPVLDAVMMGRIGRRGLVRRYSAADRSAAHQALDRLGLAALADARISDLSGGQLKRALIARAIATQPEILFLDEPTASIDLEFREHLRDLLVELNRSIPIVIVTHDLADLPDSVKNIACLNRQLYYHPGGEITPQALSEVYGCHVELVAHGHPHRVLREHERSER